VNLGATSFSIVIFLCLTRPFHSPSIDMVLVELHCLWPEIERGHPGSQDAVYSDFKSGKPAGYLSYADFL